MKRSLEGKITIEHYKSLMTQVFHHARENPQLQALATVYFRGREREMIKAFYKHAISEIGHDQLALNDVAACGGDISKIPYENPLPDTTALIAFAFYQINNLNPIGYLGYLFFLEFMPTQSGKQYIEMLQRIGIPDNAMSFIHDHSTIDVGHNKLMEYYVSKLVVTDNQYQSIIYAMKVTGHLYAKMIQGAFEQVDHPIGYGNSISELTAIDFLETNKASHVTDNEFSVV